MDNIIKLADTYAKLARENVQKGFFPPNRYIFTSNYFRKINGWDKEWYDIMNGWMAILETRGWKRSYYDRHSGESNMFNFEYLYDSELPSCSSYFSTEEIKEMIDFSQLTPEKCSQLSFNKESFFKLSNPPSKPLPEEFYQKI